ncbi:MAG: ATP-binding protein [Bacteriovoracia bacterium]
MRKDKHQTLQLLFRSSSFGILVYSILLVVPLIACVLTVAFSNSEHSKIRLLTQQLVAIIKPKIQIGDEIEIRGILSKTLETSDVLSIAITGDAIRPLVVSELASGDIRDLKETGYLDVLLSPYVVQQSVFSVYPDRPENFTVKVAFPNSIREQVIRYTFFTTLIISIALFLILLLRLKAVLRRISQPLENLRDYIEHFDRNDSNSKIAYESERLVETKSIKDKFDLLQDRIERQQSALLNQSVEEERGKLAAQLAHDLKSYTSILLHSIQNLRSKIGEDDLLILQKAASDISVKMQQLQKVGAESLDEVERSFVLQLDAFIAHLVELKAIEYSHQDRLQIHFDFLASDLGLFVKVDPVELGTAISNLVNNAVESIQETGSVTLSTKRTNDLAAIFIEDTGCGIPEGLLEDVKQYGFSTKGGAGRGKGLSKAIEIVRKDDGELSIESKEGLGTTIRLAFLEYAPRRSFVGTTSLNGFHRVIIVENDREFAKKVDDLIKRQAPKIETTVFHDLEGFQSWAKETNFPQSDFVFMDYDLGDAKITGTDTIERFGLEKRSILLTHNYGNSRLLDECDRKGIKLLPKILLEKIDFSVNRLEVSQPFDGVVIDDDDLHVIHLRKLAREKKKNLLFYRSFAEMREHLHLLDKNKVIVVDSRLRFGEKGEEHARDLYDNYGFKRIVLNTGYEKQHFKEQYPEGMYWIERIVRKDLNQVIACFESQGSVEQAQKQKVALL